MHPQDLITSPKRSKTKQSDAFCDILYTAVPGPRPSIPLASDWLGTQENTPDSTSLTHKVNPFGRKLVVFAIENV